MADFFPALAEGITTEDFPYAAAALFACPTELALPVRFPFGSYRDSVAIDVRLVQLLQQCCAESAAAGASIYIPAADAPCGGVAGNFTETCTSADNTIWQLASGLRGFAIPGRLSVIGSYSGHEIHTLFVTANTLFANQTVNRPGLQKLLAAMAALKKEAILISDGSGGQQGCAAVVTPSGERHIFLEASYEPIRD